jgi:hypothetical protein
MTANVKTLADLVAIYFAGKVKNQKELRDVIRALAETKLFDVTEEEIEKVARDNEATQGVKLF